MKRTISSSLTAAALLAGMLSGCARSQAADIGKETTATPTSVVAHPALAGLPQGASIADVAERALPAVVNISSTRMSRTDGPFLPGFFGPSAPRPEQGTGSGVIISQDGLILTNNHVIDGAKNIKITTFDKREFSAELVGSDSKSDLALIKITGNKAKLTPIEMGDSSRLRLGDVVLAIGNPFGVGQTVTMGIVSAKGRADVGIVDYEDFIQTDAAINPGNSGGALVNMEGKLVGINTAILSRTGGNMGIGFAIPSNMAGPIMTSLQKQGRVVRGWLGVTIQDVDQDLAQALKLPEAKGVLISGVQSGSPAEHAGLRQGDVVLRVDGKVVESTGGLRNLIAAAGAAASVKLDLNRDGKSVVVPVKLTEMPGDVPTRVRAPSATGGSLDGLTLEGLSPSTRRKFNIQDDQKDGVLITGVEPQSPAARAGLRLGDVLLEVNREKVTDIDRFRELYARSGQRLLLLVYRDGKTMYVVVRR